MGPVRSFMCGNTFAKIQTEMTSLILSAFSHGFLDEFAVIILDFLPLVKCSAGKALTSAVDIRKLLLGPRSAASAGSAPLAIPINT